MERKMPGNIKPWIPGLCCYIPGKTIEGYLKLASNENNYGPAPEVAAALKRAAGSINKYPYKDSLVREKVAEYCDTCPENILLANGSDESLDIIYKTFSGPVLSFRPTYSEYRIFAEALGEKYLDTGLEKDFQFPLEGFIKESRQANILVLCSPNNPTGTVIRQEDLESVLGQGKLTVVDEAYVEFYGRSAVGLVEEYPNLIVIRTFSKAFALAGLRIGYAISNPEIISLMDKVKPPFSVNALAQEAALAALGDLAYMEKTVKKIRKDREMLYREINKKFSAVRSHSNFILADVSPRKSDEVYGRFLGKRIIVRNFGKFPGFPGEYIRVSVGSGEENKRFLEALKEI